MYLASASVRSNLCKDNYYPASLCTKISLRTDLDVVSTLIDEPASSISISPINHWEEKASVALVSRVAGCSSAQHLER